MKFPFFRPIDLRRPSPLKSIEVTNPEGQTIGRAELIIGHVRRFQYAYLYYIEIDSLFRGQGLGRQLLQEVNSFLIHSQRIGLLQNFLDDPLSPNSFYRRNGWLPVPRISKGKWMYYPSIPVDPGLFPQLIHDAIERTKRSINNL